MFHGKKALLPNAVRSHATTRRLVNSVFDYVIDINIVGGVAHSVVSDPQTFPALLPIYG